MTSAPQCNIFTLGFKEKKKLSLSHFKIISLSNFQFLRASGSESSVEEQKENEKNVMQRYKILVKRT